jgi:hypothetical protein
MSQSSGSSQAAIEYNSTIIGALELGEKKWVLAVQLPGVDRHSKHSSGRGGERLLSFVERLKARCASAADAVSRCTAMQPSSLPGGSAGATGKDPT